jgi:hypothetical protein
VTTRAAAARQARRTVEAERWAKTFTAQADTLNSDQRAQVAELGATFHLALLDLGVDLTDREDSRYAQAVIAGLVGVADTADVDYAVVLMAAMYVVAAEVDR